MDLFISELSNVLENVNGIWRTKKIEMSDNYIYARQNNINQTINRAV